MRNIALQVQRTISGIVNAGSNVIFNSTIYSNGSISYNSSSGVVTFLQAGQYTVNWWIATQGSPAPGELSFALASSAGSYIPGVTPLKTGEMYGVGILNANVGTTLSLVNSTGYSVTYATGPVNASMMIAELPQSTTGPTGATGASIYTQPSKALETLINLKPL